MKIKVKKPVASSSQTGMIGGSSNRFDPKLTQIFLGYMEQVKRDMRVLTEDPVYHVPSRKFYERRIESFRADMRAMKSSTVGTPVEVAQSVRPTPRVWVRLIRRKRQK